MKKLLLITAVAILLNACEKENLSLENDSLTGVNPALAFDIASENSVLGIYKGVFTTEDSQIRGIIEMTIPGNSTFAIYYGQFPTATLTLGNGSVIKATANKTIKKNEGVVDVQFTGNGFSFTLNMNDNGKNVQFSNVILDGTTSYALVKKHTTRAPANPISGSYECGTCGGHPALDGSSNQTFSVVLSNSTPTGAADIQTMIMVGTQVVMTIDNSGSQNSCTVVGNYTECDTMGQIAVAGTTLDWTGTHRFSNNTAINCSDFDGEFTWVTNSYGTVMGTYANDTMQCINVLIEENFEGTPTYTAIADNFTRANARDYYGVVTPSTLPPNVVILPASNNYYGAQDTNSATIPANEITLNWNNIDITGLSSLNFSADFAEDTANDGNNDWNNNSTVRLEYSFNGTTWTPLIAFEAESVGGSETNQFARQDINFDGIGDNGAPFLNETLTNYSASLTLAGQSTISIRVLIDGMYAGDEDVAVDNVIVIGN